MYVCQGQWSIGDSTCTWSIIIYKQKKTLQETVILLVSLRSSQKKEIIGKMKIVRQKICHLHIACGFNTNGQKYTIFPRKSRFFTYLKNSRISGQPIINPKNMPPTQGVRFEYGQKYSIFPTNSRFYLF